jgi:NAD(P)-dependent dehydrogenase (short-subunit alcohol dehydrogenase family)
VILDKFRLDNKVALISGGSRGIGNAIATAFAEAGADVVIAGRKLPALEQAAKEISALGRRCLPVAAHAAKNEDLDNLVNQAMSEFGRIDILVCNAATSPQFGNVIDAEEWSWDAVMNLNLKGYFLLAQKVARIMVKQGGGNIIFIGSTNAFKPNRGVGVYSVSKAGEHLMAEVLAFELGKHNIRVNVLAPGATRTQMISGALDDQSTGIAKGIIGHTALGRVAEPEDMKGATVFLASEASSFITGQTIVVDGGAVTYIY